MKKYWGGFIGGELDIRPVDDGWGGYGVGMIKVPAIFTSRRLARERYQDVRPLDIREVPKPRKR